MNVCVLNKRPAVVRLNLVIVTFHVVVVVVAHHGCQIFILDGV